MTTEEVRTQVQWLLNNKYETWASFCRKAGITQKTLNEFLKGSKARNATLAKMHAYAQKRFVEVQYFGSAKRLS